MYECFHCGERMVIWDADFDPEDYGYDEWVEGYIGGVVHTLHCANCGAQIEYVIIDTENPDGN